MFSFNTNEKYIFLFSAITLLVASFFSVGFFHYDEHFQILEFAAYALQLTNKNDLPWEYAAEMRPTLQIYIAILISKFAALLTIKNPFDIAYILRLLSACLGLISMLFIYVAFKVHIQQKIWKKIFLYASFFLFPLLFLHVRFSSENWSISVFSLAISLWFILKNKNSKQIFFIGLLIGFACVLRFQMLILFASFLLYLLWFKRIKIEYYFHLFFGVFIVFLFTFFIDSYFYGDWVFTLKNYFYQNIVLNKMANFGVKPWWWYFLMVDTPWAMLLTFPFVVSLFYFGIKYPKHFFSILLFPYIIIHCFIAHKELRFLFVLIPFLPFVLVYGLQKIKWNPLFLKVNIVFFVIVNTLVGLFFIFMPADAQVNAYKKINCSSVHHVYYFEAFKDPNFSKKLSFYKQGNWTFKYIKSPELIEHANSKTHWFLVRNSKEAEKYRFKYNLVYSSYPMALLNNEIFKFIYRKPNYFLFEVPKN